MGFILTSDSEINCPHGGRVYHKSRHYSPPHIYGFPVCVRDDEYAIYDCPINNGDLRCSYVKWDKGSSTITVDDEPVITHHCLGCCYNRTGGLVTGIPIILRYQTEYTDDE